MMRLTFLLSCFIGLVGISFFSQSADSFSPHVITTRRRTITTAPKNNIHRGLRSLSTTATSMKKVTTKPTTTTTTSKFTTSTTRRGSKVDDETVNNSIPFFRWPSKENAMEDQTAFMTIVDRKNGDKNISDEQNGDGLMNPELIGAGAIAAFLATVAGLSTATSLDVSSQEFVDMIQQTFQNPAAALDQVVQSVESMGSAGLLYFGIAYTIAEILAIPAIPLTASAGYLFGPVQGTGVVLLSASIAASVSFVIGRTLLREYVENVLEDYPKFAKIDRAIGKEGFKLMLLLRLSPIFPFALSNYLYGASSINFSSFFWGTLLGFAPGTLAYVYTGYIGKALTDSADSSYPWYIYAGGMAFFAGLLKVVADTATKVVDEMEE